MANLATDLLRTTARAFYMTEHILVIDALITHSTLSDKDLAHVLGMQTKHLRKLCGRLREDGLVSVQTRAERRADGTGITFMGAPGQQARERVTHTDWYYLNFHHAIDSIKFRMYRLNKHIESLGAPTTEKKDLSCPQCGNQYTELEALDKIDMATGLCYCRRCGHELDPVEEDERVSENESMKRLNSQLEKILRLMQQIDATTVPENDFQQALLKQKAIVRTDAHPGQRIETVDLPNHDVQSSKGLEIKPEKIAVQVQKDEDVKKEAQAEEERLRKEREARQNALPDWIAKSTVTGDITAVGAKEEQLRRERDGHATVAKEEEQGEKKPAPGGGDEDVMAAYWEELAKAKEQEAAEARAEEEDEEDEEEDEFEDVDVSGNATPATNGAPMMSGGLGDGTPAHVESSNATDDEREAKKAKMEESSPVRLNGVLKVNGVVEKPAEDTPAASDEDEDELEFENV